MQLPRRALIPLITVLFLAGLPAKADPGSVRIAVQPGMTYLALNVIQRLWGNIGGRRAS